MTSTIGWQQIRLKYLYRPSGVANHPDEQVLSVYRDFGVIPKASRDDNFNKTPENVDRYLLVSPGDLVVNRMKAWQGSLGVSKHRGIVSGDYEVLNPISEGVISGFMHYLLRSQHMIGEYRVRSTGIRPSQWRLYWDQMGDIKIDLPRVPVQRAIADYLDRETAEIDTLITAQERFVDLLKERRTAVIDTAVTTGTDRNALLVETKSPWLGKAPAHWVESRFRYEVSVNGGLVDPRDAPWKDAVLIAPNHIAAGTGKLLANETAAEQGADSGKYVVKEGQIIYSKIRPALNKAVIAGQDCLCSADMYPLTVSQKVDPRYALYQILARPFRTYATLYSQRVKMPKINREDLADAPWLVPPLEEQRRIAHYIDEETAKIDTLIAKTRRHIELAKERRSALITAAVTGQVNVGRVA